MLKREKLAQTIMATDSDAFFKHNSQQNNLFFDAWSKFVHASIKVDDSNTPYAILAVDGSQIYPDRHLSDSGCFLINTGGCYLSYTLEPGQASIAKLYSEPYLFFDEQVSQELDAPFSPDIVDLKREELEFSTALQGSLKLKTEPQSQSSNFACLFDGSLIFGQLENKPEKIQNYYIKKYLEILSQFHLKNILFASYISRPASKDLVTLVKEGSHEKLESNGLSDAHLLAKTLPPGHRTALFCNNAHITTLYPDSLKPYFFYLNVGKEIVRIEVPAWIAKNDQYSNFIAQICLNQSKKGFGYPVALAEAHEQAVVKAADRDFFYHLIQRKSIQICKQVTYSQKIIKKQGMGF